MFGLGKKDDKQKPVGGLDWCLVDYLNKVDVVYMQAYNLRSMKQLQQFLSRDCAVKVQRAIFSVGSKYFGADKFRRTSWNLEHSNGNDLTITKVVEFDKVRVGGSLRINVADNYSEVWTVDYSEKNRPVVTDIVVVK